MHGVQRLFIQSRSSNVWIRLVSLNLVYFSILPLFVFRLCDCLLFERFHLKTADKTQWFNWKLLIFCHIGHECNVRMSCIQYMMQTLNSSRIPIDLTRDIFDKRKTWHTSNHSKWLTSKEQEKDKNKNSQALTKQKSK